MHDVHYIYGISRKFTPFRFWCAKTRRRIARRQGNPQDMAASKTIQTRMMHAYRLHKSVILVGMMGAGKTAVGTATARMLGVPFLDSDDEIARAAQRTITEIFARDGEAFFRARESEVLGRLLQGDPVVLSTGGGAFLNDQNRAMIKGAGAAVWLRADLDLLWQRVRHKTTRPLLRTADPRGTLAQLYAVRTPIYALADLVVDAVPDLSVDGMAQKVIAALATRPDVLAEAGA
jgi:shikimate kinase